MGSENMFFELPCETKYFEAENSGCMYNFIIELNIKKERKKNIWKILIHKIY